MRGKRKTEVCIRLQVFILSAAFLFLAFLRADGLAGSVPNVLEEHDGSGYLGAIYHPDPAHPWNRVFHTLYSRKFGHQEWGLSSLDPLLWEDSVHLLENVSYRRAYRELNRFLESSAYRLIREPKLRALFQRDLLQAFNWLSSRKSKGMMEDHRRILMDLLVQIIRRVALYPSDMRHLPDPLWQALDQRLAGMPVDLHPDLYESTWTLLNSRELHAPIGEMHHVSTSGQSAFFVLLRLPYGRPQTQRYLDLLNLMRLRPSLPLFPKGTLTALVRQAILVDPEGNPYVSPITEAVDLVAYPYAGQPPTDAHPPSPQPKRVTFHQDELLNQREQIYVSFALNRQKWSGVSGKLVRGSALERLPMEQKMLPVFGSEKRDPFLLPSAFRPVPRKVFCGSCHFSVNGRKTSGIYSVQAFTRDFAGYPKRISLEATPPSAIRREALQYKLRHSSQLDLVNRLR